MKQLKAVKGDYYAEYSAGVLIAVRQISTDHRWWASQLDYNDTGVARQLPRFDINRKRMIY